ncbi:MAG: DUF2341 domain-containing protein [Promethearchaeota archaeon]
MDGSFDSSTPHSGNVRNNRRYINIGRNTHDGISFNGIIDDVHISNIDRSADWIATEYNNQYDPSSFYSIGTEERVGLSINDFNYYKEITIDHTKVSGSINLINFPLLISILDTDLYDKVQSNGNDIAFYNGTQWLDHEIEVFNQTYSGTEAQLVAWVRIPSLSPTTDTKIYMYYGNSTMGPQENPTGVWDSNYQAVWHLSEDPSGSAPQILDSTLNNYDGTSYGSMTSGDQIAGQIDGSLDFDGSDDEVSLPGVVIGDLAAWTLSAWIRMGPDIADQRTIYSEGNTTETEYLFLYVDDTNSEVKFYSETATGDYAEVIGSTNVEDNQWHLVTLVQRSKTDRELYVDGLSDGTNTDNAGTLTTDTATIGALNYLWDVDQFIGTIDEIHISSIDRSNDWIATEYNNQYDPDSFYTVGDDTGPSVDDFDYYKEITIDHTKVSGSSNLINFPVLISILDTDLYDKVQSNGNDIAFYNGTQWLDHEIEVFNQTYSGTQAQLVAWVRIPSLSPTTDTKIYMYYGNSTMSPQENPTGVWDANYVGVWHLSENPSGTIYDSTSYNNDGTSNGNVDQVNGIIDGSLNFNGANDYIDCGNNNSLDITENITIEQWIKGDDFSNDPDTLTKGTYEEAYSVWILADGRITLELNNGTFRSLTAISTGDWNFVTCTYDGTTRRIYLNGTEDNSGAYSTPIETVTGALTISSNPWSFDGLVDEVRISNIVRSPDWLATQFNNQDDPNSFYTIGNDTEAPSITINAPNANDLFGSNAPSYNLTVADANLDSIWFSLDGGSNSTPVSDTGTIDQAMWSGRPNGTVTIRFYANDTLGNLNYTDVVVRKDIVDPSIDSIDSPSSGAWFNSAPPGYSLSITEANLAEIWYTLDGGVNNYTGALSGTIDSTAWSNAGQGSVTIIFYVNDSVGNWDSASIGINRDTIDPSIDSIDSPSSGAWFASSPPGYSLSITETNLDEIWYTLDGGVNNYTGASSGTIDSTAWSNTGQGSVTIIFYVNDSAGNWDSASININRDTIDPSIDSINSPSPNSNHSTPPIYSLSITETNLDEIWYTLDGGVNNYTGASSGTINSTAWSNAGQGSVTIIFYVNDSAGNWDSASININRDTIDPSIDSIDSPSSGAWFNSVPPGYSLSITEANLDEIWYTLDGGINNYTGALSGTIDSTAWSNAGQGSVTIIFYVNDSAGNWDSASININRDTIDPSIDSINSPSPSSNHSTPPIYSLSITEANLEEIWYTLDGGINNYTGALSGTIDSIAWGNAGLGSVTITFYVNDSLGNWDSASVGVTKTSDLSISINSPNTAEWFRSIPDYDIYVSGNDRDSIWYTLDNGLNNFTITSNADLSNNWLGVIDSTAWSSAGQGSITINFYLNDTFGITVSDSVQIFKDTIDPIIDSINTPTSGAWFNGLPPSYSLSITETNLDEIWYTLDGGVNNYTGALSGAIDSTAWSNAGQGSVTITFYVNDSVGNWDSMSVDINRDTIDPSINSINSPSSGAWFNSIPPGYSLSITEANLDEIWYTLDGGINNYTGALSGTIDSTAWSNAGQGSVTITFYVNDSAGNWDSLSVDINRDTIDPTIAIIEPNNYDLFGITPPDITININDPNLDASWYQLDNGTVITSNYTWTGLIAQGVWDQVGNGTVIIRFYSNDTASNIGTAEVTVYKDIFFPIITINTPNSDEVCNSTAPNFMVSVSGSNLDSRWYTLDNGLVNYTFIGLTGTIDLGAWDAPGDGTVTIKFYINNTLGVIGFDEITVIKDTLVPLITINLPLNNTYYGTAPLINILASDANLEYIWYEVNTIPISLGNNVDQQLDTSIWDSLPEGEFNIYLFANDTVSHLSDPIMITLYKDTVAPVAPLLLNFPQGEVSGNLIFEWQEGSDLSGIVEYRLIIDNEDDPITTPGTVFEIYVTGNNYTYIGSLQPDTYYFFLYQIDGAGHQSPATTGSFSIRSSSQPSPPSEFPLWIIFVIIGAAVGGLVGVMVLKKSKNKKVGSFKEEAPPKELEPEIQVEIEKELTLLDNEVLKAMNREELIAREKILVGTIKGLEETQKYVKATELLSEVIIIEELLDNPSAVQSYRQMQIDFAVNGLDYLKDQYEIESRNAAGSGDYSKSLELYKESKVIAENLKLYLEQQKSALPKKETILESMEKLEPIKDTEIVYSCINDLLTKYFDDIGIKYYYNPQIYDDMNKQTHGLILTDDKFLIQDVDPSIRDKIKAIQILFVEDISNTDIRKLAKMFQNPSMIFIIIGIKWSKDVESQIVELNQDKKIRYPENIKLVNYHLFADLIGLKGTYKVALEEIVHLYDHSDIDILQKSHESSTVRMHDTKELIQDLKDKGLIKKKLKEYFHT